MALYDTSRLSVSSARLSSQIALSTFLLTEDPLPDLSSYITKDAYHLVPESGGPLSSGQQGNTQPSTLVINRLNNEISTSGRCRWMVHVIETCQLSDTMLCPVFAHMYSIAVPACVLRLCYSRLWPFRNRLTL